MRGPFTILKFWKIFPSYLFQIIKKWRTQKLTDIGLKRTQPSLHSVAQVGLPTELISLADKEFSRISTYKLVCDEIMKIKFISETFKKQRVFIFEPFS